MKSYLHYFNLDIFVNLSGYLTPSEALRTAKANSNIAKILSDADFWTKRFVISENSASELTKKDNNGCSWLNVLGNIANTRILQIDNDTKTLWYEILAIKPSSDDAVYNSILLIREVQKCSHDSDTLDDLIKKIKKLEPPSKNLKFILEKLEQIKKLQSEKKSFQSLIALISDPFDKLEVAINYPYACTGLKEFEELTSQKGLQEMFILAIQKDRKDVAQMILSLLKLSDADAVAFVSNLIKQKQDVALKYLFDNRNHLPHNLKALFCAKPQSLADLIMYYWQHPQHDEKIITYIALIKRFYSSKYDDGGYTAFSLLRKSLVKEEKSYYGFGSMEYNWKYTFTDIAVKFFEQKRGALVHALFENKILDNDKTYTLKLGNTKLSGLERSHLAAIADAPDSIDTSTNFANIFVSTQKYSMLRACVSCLCCCYCCGLDGNYTYRRSYTANPLQLALIFHSPKVTERMLAKYGTSIDTNNWGHRAIDIADELLKDKQPEKVRTSYKQTAMNFYKYHFLQKNTDYFTERSVDQGRAIKEKDGMTRHYKYYLSFFGIKEIGLGCSYEAKEIASKEVESYIKAGGVGKLSKAAQQGRLGRILREFESVNRKINR